MSLSRLAVRRVGFYAIGARALACGDGVLRLSGEPQTRGMSWFTGTGDRPRISQSRVLSSEEGHLFLIESEIHYFNEYIVYHYNTF